jgi:O-acetyl-ADP-ribose deacetylase (regulator of RNase III)
MSVHPVGERRMSVEAQIGDLTTLVADAVVTAANPYLAGGGGLDGVIHRAAGPDLLAACQSLPAVGGVRCPTGESRPTEGFRLPAKWIIHTVGPIFSKSPDPEGELAAAYRSAFVLAEEMGVRTIGFPALSCGCYGFPPRLAAPIAVGVAFERPWKLDRAIFVFTERGILSLWDRAIRSMGEQHSRGA